MSRGFDEVASLLSRVTDRVPLEGPGKSGAVLERGTFEGRPCVVKYLDSRADWTMRAAGIPGGATHVLWQRGFLDLLPVEIAQPVLAIGRDDAVPELSVLVMEDVGASLVPATDDPIPLETHELFLDHMAALHARFWEAGDLIDVVSAERRYLELSPRMAAAEAELEDDHLVPRLVAQGWPLLAEVAPAASAIVTPLVHDPARLLQALEATPQTFVHGNWKLDNLGVDDAGRTVLLDWELPGRGAPLSDLAWYLAINCRRLPTDKETAIEVFHAALERHGVETEPWWDTQLGLCLIGALVQFGWEKALGGYDEELAWWEEQAVRAEPLL